MFFGVGRRADLRFDVRSMPVCPLPRERKVTKKAARTLSIENVPLGILKLDRCNPRQHSRQQIAQIARSIEAFGFNVPILVDENLTVLAGHGWARAGQQIGWQEVHIIRLAHLSEAQARAFSIADNRLTDNSTWDDRLLGEIFRDLSAVELEFNIEAYPLQRSSGRSAGRQNSKARMGREDRARVHPCGRSRARLRGTPAGRPGSPGLPGRRGAIRSPNFAAKGNFCEERVEDSSTVEQRTLTPSILVRIQVPQPYTSLI
jgi:ParB-like nuclease family protein